MKVLHSYCLNFNIGDYYLGIGVKNLLRRYLPVELIAETNLQGTVFNEYFIDNVVNKKYDLLVIGGGGIIHGAHWPNGWFWLIREELIERIKIPFIVYGAGYNYFADEGGIPPVGKLHLAKTLRHAAYFSVRNDGSQTRLRDQTGIDASVVPDPGFHINMDRTYENPENEPFVVVQLANDKPEHRFRGAEGEDAFVAGLRQSVTSLSRKYKVILAPHVHDDLAISQRVAEGIDNTTVWDFSRFAFDRSVESVGYYQNAEFVIAMRGHGQIVPFAFGTPVISLENHPKHVGLMHELGVEAFNLPVTTPDLGSALEARIAMLESQLPSYRAKLQVQNERLDEQTRRAFSDIRTALGLA